MELSSAVTSVPLIGSAYQRKLENLNIHTVNDLLLHLPSRYEDYRKVRKISGLMFGESTTIQGTVDSIKNNYTRRGKNFQSAVISDTSGSIQIIWFNQPYISKNLNVGDKVSISGKVGEFSKRISFISPSYEVIRGNKTVHTAKLVPVYPETAGVSSKWLRSRINHILKAVELEEYIPNHILDQNNLIDYDNAINWIHNPTDFQQIEAAKKRLAFNEMLDIHIQTAQRKKQWKKNTPSHDLQITNEIKKEFIDLLSFKLTKSQERSIDEIYNDLTENEPMNRLLEGDVGSGKTIVAAAAAFASFKNGYKTVFMAPTQILADQHFKSLKEHFDDAGINVELIISGTKNIDGNSEIFVGTHALIHDKVDFEDVAVVIIDEQHRFGVEQREHLITKTKEGRKAPHVLTMTATPIPRTVALTFYGDLDLSTLDEIPKGRQSITTWVVPTQKRNGAYDWIRQQIQEKNIQVFVVCPIIEESEHESMQQIKAATTEHEKLEKIYSDLSVGLLHGKQKSDQKTKILNEFKEHKIDILVSTPVVEVGIDIPNAAIMVIEGADRFGLAQLHQLRGRVGRGENKSYCLLFTESESKKTKQRLQALTKMNSGFELAELDLQLRGPGEVLGTKQHGFLELKAADWQDADLIKKTKKIAIQLTSKPRKYQDFFEKRYGGLGYLN